MLYQLGRNSNTHFFRYLLRHIEHDFTIKEKRAQREERRRFRRPTQHINGGEQSDPESIGTFIRYSRNMPLRNLISFLCSKYILA